MKECITLLCFGVPKSANLMTFLRPKKKAKKRLKAKKMPNKQFLISFENFEKGFIVLYVRDLPGPSRG